MAKPDVPADTLPVRSTMLLVATMPVPASPSGGQSGIPACSFPVGSMSLAPSAVSSPADCPATRTAGRMRSRVQGSWASAIRSLNCSIMRVS